MDFQLVFALGWPVEIPFTMALVLFYGGTRNSPIFSDDNARFEEPETRLTKKFKFQILKEYGKERPFLFTLLSINHVTFCVSKFTLDPPSSDT